VAQKKHGMPAHSAEYLLGRNPPASQNADREMRALSFCVAVNCQHEAIFSEASLSM